MKRIALVVSMLCVALSGCGSTGNKAVTKVAPVSKDENRAALVLSPATFADHIDTRKIAVECNILDKLNGSIIEHGPTYTLKVELQKEGESVPANQDSLVVEYIAVDPNKWGFLAIRPHSIATVKASILKNGEVFKVMQKDVHSYASFGSCDRLEKIGVAHGKYIARWASQNGY